jgi:hypothetical protein
LGLQRSLGNKAVGQLFRRQVPEFDRMPTANADDEPLEAPDAGHASESAVIVEDDATDAGTGQMKKSEFLARLRPAVLAAAEAGLTDKSRAAQAGTLVDGYVAQYEAMDAAQINTALSRAVPDERPTTAEGFISAIAARVRVAVATWEATGELPEGPSLSDLGMPGAGLFGGLLGGIGGAILGARVRGFNDTNDPLAVQARLGTGRPLDAAVRSRMESVFGRSFARVRVHTDSAAAGLSTRFNAQAFTVGSHIAFGAQKFRPGSLIGDALIAHELAHVAQQHDPGSPTPLRDAAPYHALERDADLSTAGAVAAMWTGLRGLIRSVPSPEPRLRSGLSLQRCESCNCSPQQTAQQAAPAQPGAAGPRAACEPTPAPYATIRGEGAPEGTLGFTKLDPSSQLICAPDITPGGASGTCAFRPKPVRLAFISKYTYAGDHPTTMTRPVPKCGNVPVVFRVSEEVAAKAKQAEQEHCGDLQLAFDRTLKPCSEALARLTGTPLAGANSEACFADFVSKLGFDPLSCTEEFIALSAASDERDTRDWHTFDSYVISTDCRQVILGFTPTRQTKIGTVAPEALVPQATKCGTAAPAPQAAPNAPPPSPPKP